MVTSAPGAVSVDVPPADEAWHELALDWYLSLAESGQSGFYEPSDWATARILAEVLSRVLASSRPSAMLLQAWQSGATELLTTEGARRRMRLELERLTVDPDAEQADAMILDLESRLRDDGA